MLICLDQRTGTGCGAENRDGAAHCSQCGRNLRFAMQLQNVGALVGSYHILRLIGHGGFGAVYQAEDTHTRQQVALKESFDADSIRNFQREFTVLQHLQHPNLPLYFQVFEAQGNGYLAMEFVPGQNLEEVLRANAGQPLFESQVIGYALQVCDALTYLHTQSPPLFHRDIKPANIRITPAGLIKLVDFGLVKQGTGATASSQRAVTPAYAPLEQYGRIAGAHTNARSDIYALGATLYHLLTGREPVPSIERIAVHPDPLPAPQTLNPRLSHNVLEAIETAMKLSQQDRFGDASELRNAMVGTRPLPTPAPPPRQAPPPVYVPPKPTPAPQIMIPPTPTIALPARIINKAGQEMVFIPAGEFLMGSDRNDDEKPIHPVYLDAFYISRYPVTNVEYKKFVQVTGHAVPYHWKSAWIQKTIAIPNGKENHPVVSVNWNDAVAYCKWAGGRLPTEAEWEKAAGWDDAHKRQRVYPWGDVFDSKKCNSRESGIGDTTPVGKYSPQGDSSGGAGDLSGNVWEWVADWYDENYYQNSPRNNPEGPASGSYRVLRGGSFYFNQDYVRAALRSDYYSPDVRNRNLGFRCAQ